ncbi:hypothetical protein BOX15_Mlig029425g1 [Macrostomum lignano]|uniref:STAS domain-containing protein n=1 Tax=Macrostomum lignano TaxID=282301 RepID=A0A267GTL6_9PLAT|nr:hypothetical protein BOX15_Mlig029425g1 [Macrostomum lignano]
MAELPLSSDRCCSLLTALLPIAGWLPKYDLQKLRQDAVAGLTVGLMVIPQGLAYAHVAELPVQYGLYSAFMGPFVYCLLGTSKDASLGPTAIMSLLTASYNAAPGVTSKSAVYAVLMCFACGIVQFLLGAMRLGVIVNFISLPVVSGFTTSAAVTIAWSQVKSLLGLRGISNWLPLSVYEICRDIGRTKVWDLTLGLSCMALLLVLMKIQRDISKASRIDATEDGDVHLGVRSSRAFLAIVCSGRNALIVACASLVAFSLKSVDLGDKLTLTQKVDSRLPPFRPPAFQLMNGTQVVRDFWQIVGDIGIGFAVVPFIGLVESIAIARVFARSGNYRIDASQELIAIGLSNLAGSFVSSYPVTGSFTRTAINYQSGVRTPAGGIFTGTLVLLALALLGDLFQFIPQAALAAVIIVAVLQMTDFRMLRRLWFVSKTDLLEWLVTFLVSLAAGIQYGILCGMGLSFAFLLYRYSRPGLETSTQSSGLAVVTVKSAVRFPAADGLELSLVAAAQPSEGRVRHVCADLSLATGIDFAVVEALKTVRERLRLLSARLFVVARQPEVRQILEQAGLSVFESVQAAESGLSASAGASEVTPLIT